MVLEPFEELDADAVDDVEEKVNVRGFDSTERWGLDAFTGGERVASRFVRGDSRTSSTLNTGMILVWRKFEGERCGAVSEAPETCERGVEERDQLAELEL